MITGLLDFEKKNMAQYDPEGRYAGYTFITVPPGTKNYQSTSLYDALPSREKESIYEYANWIAQTIENKSCAYGIIHVRKGGPNLLRHLSCGECLDSLKYSPIESLGEGDIIYHSYNYAAVSFTKGASAYFEWLMTRSPFKNMYLVKDWQIIRTFGQFYRAREDKKLMVSALCALRYMTNVEFLRRWNILKQIFGENRAFMYAHFIKPTSSNETFILRRCGGHTVFSVNLLETIHIENFCKNRRSKDYTVIPFYKCNAYTDQGGRLAYWGEVCTRMFGLWEKADYYGCKKIPYADIDKVLKTLLSA